MYSRRDKDVATCLRRQNCQPLGGRNVWATLNEIESSSSDRLILATAGIDSSAFFHDQAIGSDADISGTVALLGAIEALGKVNADSWVKQPLFVLFTGEAFGFIGSHSFVKDISNFTCTDPRGTYCRYPYRLDTTFDRLHLDMIDAYLELNQVGFFPNDGTYALEDGGVSNQVIKRVQKLFYTLIRIVWLAILPRLKRHCELLRKEYGAH